MPAAGMLYKTYSLTCPKHQTTTFCLINVSGRSTYSSVHFGDRTFPVAATRLWNSLPSHVTAATLPSRGRNWAGADRPQPFSTRFASVFQFCVTSLWEDPECRSEELENGPDWCRHDKGGQRESGTVDG